ncbi:MAG: methyl-accepting chemotaxis protein [Tagaea sp.]|nr:methyl-accepting chemotaxis protein [Tagaea sp.]
MLGKLFGGQDEAGTQAKTLLETAPIALMTVDIATFKIDYANARSVALLRSIRHLLKIDPDRIVGTSIDVFHAKPEHQRRLLSDPKNLPHKARITLGTETLDLHIEAVRDSAGVYKRAMLAWSVATDLVRKEKETARLLQMIDNMPINVMTCDPVDFKIDYANKTSLETLRKVQQYIPVRAENLIGTSIDVFHKNPSHQRGMLADGARLPHVANIKVGPETLNLRVSAIRDDKGAYLGPMVSWSIVTDGVRMAESVTGVVKQMSSTAESMDGSARAMLDVATRAENMAGSVSAAAEEMTASIGEIASRIAAVSTMSQKADQEAAQANKLVATLTEAAGKIGSVTEAIESIAAKTNLLALNATIEAARAGEAGKGFAVVASEVKGLSQQTATATTEIKTQIGEVQGVVKQTVDAIGLIGKTISELSVVFAQIAAAVKEQRAATAEVARAITGVSEASRETGASAQSVREVAEKINDYSGKLDGEIKGYMASVR